MSDDALPASRARLIGFAHRGAPRCPSEQNTIEAFQRALTLGATGLESDIALTADGEPVLIHPHFIRRGPNVSRLRRSQLPAHIPTLADLYRACGTRFELSLDMMQPSALDAVVNVAARFGAVDRLWINYWHLSRLETWRSCWPEMHLVYASIPALGRGDQLVRRLAALRVDVVNVHHLFCTASLVERAHAEGVGVFAWGIRRRRSLARVARFGVDGVFCDNVPEMVGAINASLEQQT